MVIFNKSTPNIICITLLQQSEKSYYSLFLFYYQYKDFLENKRNYNSSIQKDERGLTLVFIFEDSVDLYTVQQEFLFVYLYFFNLKGINEEIATLATESMNKYYPRLIRGKSNVNTINTQIINSISPAYDGETHKKILPNYFLDMKHRDVTKDLSKLLPEYKKDFLKLWTREREV